MGNYQLSNIGLHSICMARDEWQWIDSFLKIRLLPGEVERDRWLSHAEAACLIAACPPHLAALVRFALATGCRAREITGLEWNRVDLTRGTAWLNHTKMVRREVFR